MKQIKENLIKIEEVLNQHEQYEIENGCVDYSLKLNKDNTIQFKILDDEYVLDEDKIVENYKIELSDFDIKSIVKSIINYLYENEINHRSTFIRSTRAYNNRKIKSMALWLGRGNQDKVDLINKDLVHRHDTTNKMKSDLVEFKGYVRDLYNCMSNLCPTWKINDIVDYCNSRLCKLGLTIDINIVDNKIVANGLEIAIDNYTKKENVYDLIYKNIKGIA
ncbi:MAG: hypothetical protein N4A63_08180 [Vallitalea sp.]|nr:hypothetical protein [Vallitalea sp.]